MRSVAISIAAAVVAVPLLALAQEASNAEGTASNIFWPSRWVSSGTVTLDLRPAQTVSTRLEYRHDQAEDVSFFRRDVPANGAFNAKRQDTVTLGMTTWF